MRTSPCSSNTSVTYLRKLLDPREMELVVPLADGESHALTGNDAGAVDDRGIAEDRHQLHRPHAECWDVIVTDEQEVRGGTRDDGSADLVRGGTNQRAPDASGERGEEN